jgi:hypothetical protein
LPAGNHRQAEGNDTTEDAPDTAEWQAPPGPGFEFEFDFEFDFDFDFDFDFEFDFEFDFDNLAGPPFGAGQ